MIYFQFICNFSYLLPSFSGYGFDYTEQFYQNPAKIINSYLSQSPTHIVLFDSLLPEIEPYLSVKGYDLVMIVSIYIFFSPLFFIPIFLYLNLKKN